MSKKTSYFILFVILLFGSWLRIAGILTDSFAFTYDVGRDLLKVREIVIDHNLTLIGQTTGLAGLFYGPWWYYILVVPFLIFQGNPQGIALFIALVNIVAIFFCFFVGKKVGGYFLGLVFAALVSFSPYMVGLGAQIWNPNISPLLVALCLLLMLLVYSGRKDWRILLSLGFILGLTMESEIVFGSLLLVSVIAFSLITHREKISRKNFLSFAVGFLVTLLPRALFELTHGFIMTKTIIAGGNSGSFSIPSVESFGNVLWLTIQMFADALTRGSELFATVLIAFCLVVVTVFRNKANKDQMFLVRFALTVFIVFLIGLSFLSHSLYGHYLIVLPMFFILLVSISLFLLQKTQLKIISYTLFGLLVFVNLDPVVQIQNAKAPLWEGNGAVYRNQIAVIDYIYKNAEQKKFNYTAYSPAVYDYTYQYLFLWYGPKQYGYAPSVKAERLLYVILEPDEEKPTRLTDWLKIRDGDGVVMQEKKIKGGIIVQTRNRKLEAKL